MILRRRSHVTRVNGRLGVYGRFARKRYYLV